MKSLEILKIIRACASNNVKSLKLGDFSLEFQAGDTEQLGFKLEPLKPPEEQELKAAETLALEADRLAEEDDDLSTLQIDDPARYEELLVQRELEFSGPAPEAFDD